MLDITGREISRPPQWLDSYLYKFVLTDDGSKVRLCKDEVISFAVVELNSKRSEALAVGSATE